MNKKPYKVINGNMLEILPALEENTFDSCITDPPYELNFMGKSWDNSGVAFQKETWQQVLRVLKPGAYLLAFGGSRTYHRIACAIEDAGFEIKDCIMWLYGCLSEDTEVLTDKGFKRFHKITKDDKIRIYDTENNIYKWERPERWSAFKVNNDTCFHIKSNTTDQIVSKNHRVYVERDGKLLWEFAENLSKMERVPVLSYDIPFIQESESDILFTDLLWQDENLAQKLFCERQGNKKQEKGYENGKEPCLERWNNLSQEKRELCLSKYQVCKVSQRVYNYGEKRWLCNGTQVESGASNTKTTLENRSCAPYQPQCRGQQIRKSNVVCNEQGTQTLRKWKTYKTTLATITPIKYSGTIFCPTVSTGCFVARRNGKVFLTGNSGFPKSMDISKAIESKILNGSANSTEFKKLKGEKVESGNWGMSKMAKDQNARPTDYSADKHLRTTKVDYQTEEAKKWEGWGTQLKPAYEPIIVARKPCEKTTTENVMTYGTGAINIDECRVGNELIKGGTMPDLDFIGKEQTKNGNGHKMSFGQVENAPRIECGDHIGRFPANVILTYDETDKDEVCGGMWNNEYRYFYCAKASKKDRDEGLDLFETKTKIFNGQNDKSSTDIKDVEKRFTTEGKNIHPTVKPTELMQYLIRLTTRKGGLY